MNIKRVFLCAMVSSALVSGPAFAAVTLTQNPVPFRNRIPA